MKKRLKMTMSVNDENSAGAANNNNCSKADLDHYDSPVDIGGRPMWPPCPAPPPSTQINPGGWIGPDITDPVGPTYTPLVKVKLQFKPYKINSHVIKIVAPLCSS